MDENPDDDAPSVPALLSARQVAEIFGRKERTLRNWVRAGHLRPVRVGRAVFFREADIVALLEAGEPPTPEVALLKYLDSTREQALHSI